MMEEEELSVNDADLHLGMGSLIGIFFGLALVCGVFFGFGYMMGHRPSGPYVSSEPLYVAPKPAAAAPKPSAQFPAQPEEVARVIVPAVTATDSPASDGITAAQNAAAISAAPPTPQLGSNDRPAPPSTSVSAPAAGSAGNLMVQIAAVRNRSDAEALAAALRKNGFNPTIRTETQDKFLHVQIGPFESRELAKQMRQKLSSAGYNAFIK